MTAGPRIASAGLLAAVLLSAALGAQAAQSSVFPISTPAEEPAREASVPDPAALEPGWWQSLGPDATELSSRVDAVLKLAAERVAGLPESEQAAGEETLARLRANLRGYLRLRQRDAESPPRASTFRDQYSLDEILKVDRDLRLARVRLEGDIAELDSRKGTVSSLSRQVDNRFAAYVNTPARSAERLLDGLQVMATRSGWLLEQQQVRLLGATVEALKARVSQLQEEVTVARERVSFDGVTAAALDREAETAGKNLESERRKLRRAEAELIDVVADSRPDDPAVAVARQRVTLQSVLEAEAQLALAGITARSDLLVLSGDPDAATLSAAEERVRRLGETVERIRSRLRGWTESGEQGLSESAAAITGDVERGALERRAELAARILSELQGLRRAIGDVELLEEMADEALLSRQGRLRSTLTRLGQRIADGWDTVLAVATTSLVTIGEQPITLAGIFRVLLILTAAFWVSRLVRHALNRMGASKRTGMSQSSLYSLGRLLHYVIIIAGIVIGLSSIGLDFTNLALVASALGVGIGFGLQSVVSNFVSGLILLFERSLNVGDFVELDSGVTGVIKEINVRSTLLNTNDNVDILVPNSEFVNGKLINWTLREAVKRVHIPFGVAYGTDKDLTKKAALEAAERVELTLHGPGREPQVWLVNFGDSSLDYELVVWLGANAVRRPAAVQAAYLWEIETSLAEHGIEIPFPQRDLHLRSGLEALRPAGAD